MLAVAYCYLVSVYAKLNLHSLQFADNVGWRTTTSFMFHSDVLPLRNFIFSSVLFNRFWHSAHFQNPQWHVAHFRNTQRHVDLLYIFSIS